MLIVIKILLVAYVHVCVCKTIGGIVINLWEKRWLKKYYQRKAMENIDKVN